ncbi:GNAT family N-acetyltransferase [Undibacter mobilis]|uniref:GNAT family N-acetyltransferase n=1 Tax=Undibacter mobilis TaxID=2292256 RepID=A0A371B2Y8_9BRAD|nr:GNAT family N-acetyltransferase [Undibacter mobilis]RDV01884.1 GNAT family N-acetyltransferase [Undibacter mobilis]
MKTESEASRVTLARVDKADLPEFKKELRDSFSVAVIEAFGAVGDGTIPSDDDVDSSFAAPGSAVYHILSDGKKVGGAVVSIDEATQHNALDLFFISAASHGHGIGTKAWAAIEAMYPDTKVWETHTPYFEKRNIHFYVNKCGFKIVDFYHEHHPLPDKPPHDALPGGGEFFRFEKVMRG